MGSITKPISHTLYLAGVVVHEINIHQNISNDEFRNVTLRPIRGLPALSVSLPSASHKHILGVFLHSPVLNNSDLHFQTGVFSAVTRLGTENVRFNQRSNPGVSSDTNEATENWSMQRAIYCWFLVHRPGTTSSDTIAIMFLLLFRKFNEFSSVKYLQIW